MGVGRRFSDCGDWRSLVALAVLSFRLCLQAIHPLLDLCSIPIKHSTVTVPD